MPIVEPIIVNNSSTIQELVTNVITPTPSDHSYLKTNFHVSTDFPKLKFMALNVCGLFSKLKYGIFEETIKDIDFVCLSETKTNFIPEDEFHNFHALFSKKSHQLAVLVNKKCTKYFKLIEDTKSKWIMFLAVGSDPANLDFILANVYIPCEKSVSFSESVFEEISTDIINIKSKFDLPFVLMGDCNARTADAEDFLVFEDELLYASGFLDDFSHNLDILNLQKRYNLDKNISINGNGLLNFCKHFNFIIVNGRFGKDRGVGNFTCFKSPSGTVLDYVIVSDCLIPQITDFSVGDFDKTLSDVHCPLFFSIKSNHVLSDQVTNSTPETATIQKHQNFIHKWKTGINSVYKNAFSPQAIQDLSASLETHLGDSNISQENMDKIVSNFNNLFLSTAKTVGLCKPPKKNVRKYTRIFPNKIWFDKECEVSRKHYIKVKNSKTGKKFKRLKDSLFKDYKKLLSSKEKLFKKETENKLRSLKHKNSREYWKILNHASNSKKKETNISMQALFEHFKKLSFKEQDESPFDPRDAASEHTISEELNRNFTVAEIIRCIKKLKNNKACGIDLVINEYLKNCPQNVIVLIVNLFNLVLNTGVVPTEWGEGLIQPIFKNKGSKNSANNYRGITFLCCLGKLFTSVLNDRATNFVEKRGIIGEEQAGFRAGYSTTDHIFVLNSLIQFYKARCERLYCAFIDYMKAFDLIVRSDLWRKLIGYEINGKFIAVIYNLYASAKSCVKKGGDLSEFFLCNIGVRQGENLSPLLFSIFLNDFERHVSSKYNGLPKISSLCSTLLSDEDITVFINLFVLLYADDTIVFAESEEGLQNALNGVYEYCKMWHLSVNVDKTKVVIFSRGKVKKYRNFLFGASPLEVIDQYIYLGMLFNYDGTFYKTAEKQIQQATRAMYSLLTKARRLSLPLDITCELFDQTVLPVLTYACEVWGCGNLNSIEVFYRKFLKMILHLNASTPNCIIYGEVGKLPLRKIIYQKMIAFWMKVSEDKPSKFSNIIYRVMFQLHKNPNPLYNFQWFNKIEQVLSSCNFSNLWRDQENYSTKKLLKNSIFKTLNNLEQQNWLDSVNNNRLCYNYRIFKLSLSFEQYLIELPFVSRVNLSKFRSGNNKLPANKHKFNVTADKSCPLCNTGDLGDEFHYILICNFFLNDRKKCINSDYYNPPNTLKMSELFNNNCCETRAKLCKFISIILKKFN